MVAVKFQAGALFKIPLDGDFAYGVMLSRFPYMAFYGKDVSFDEYGAPVEDPLFTVAVSKISFSAGRWGSPIRVLPEGGVAAIPKFFWQSPVSKADCKIIDPVARRKMPALPGDCLDMERDAVWSPEHIESRIIDHYAGRKNIYVESLRPKI